MFIYRMKLKRKNTDKYRSIRFFAHPVKYWHTAYHFLWRLCPIICCQESRSRMTYNQVAKCFSITYYINAGCFSFWMHCCSKPNRLISDLLNGQWNKQLCVFQPYRKDRQPSHSQIGFNLPKCDSVKGQEICFVGTGWGFYSRYFLIIEFLN